LDAGERRLSKSGAEVAIPPKIFDTLVVLVEHRGRLVDKNKLIAAIWPSTAVSDVSLARNISDLRKILEDGNGTRYIETVPKKGYRWIAEVRVPLQAVAAQATTQRGVWSWMIAVLTGSGFERLRHGFMLSLLSLVVMIGVALVAWAIVRTNGPNRREPQPVMRLNVDLGPEASLGSALGPDAILSPDGTRLVYISHGRLFRRQLDQPEATELPGTQGATSPFFSPDGRSVAFFAEGKLKRAAIDGGPTSTLCDAVEGRGGSWGEDGTIIAALASEGGLSEIPPGGGAPRQITETDRGHGEITHRWPQILPGGMAVVFTTNSANGYDGASIDVLSLKDHRRKTLQRGGTFGRVAGGNLYFVRGGTLFASPFDAKEFQVTSKPEPVIYGISYSPASGFARIDFSESGTVVYRTGETAALVGVQWLQRSGTFTPLLENTGRYLYPRLSPDNRRLALASMEGLSQDIWVYELLKNQRRRLTFGELSPTNPVWTPDGSALVFQAIGGLYWSPSDGSAKPQVLAASRNLQIPWSFTPDGKLLAYMEVVPGRGYDLWVVPIHSDGHSLAAGKPAPLLQTAFDERYPSFSPEGRWFAYASNESGAFQVYVRASPDNGRRWQVSTGGGLYPMWSRTGHQLFFRTEDNQIMTAAYDQREGSFEPDKARLWSPRRLADVGLYLNFDVASDGEHIAALIPDVNQPQNRVVFIVNFLGDARFRTK
jgi:serine/threonine-protein kinase